MDELDATAACAPLASAHARRVETEALELRLAVHWADLHNGDARDAGGRVLPGMERAKRLGGPGTPAVREFAAAELAPLLGIGYISAENLMADGLDLRHRHPRLWALVQTGQVRDWQGRKIVHMTHEAGLSLERARWVDAQTAHRIASLPWSQVLDLVAAKIIEVDPEAAEARRQAAEAARFVRTGRSDDHGLKTLIARASAGEVIYFVAMTDRIAQILKIQGDQDSLDVRRSKAIGILANPARAYALLHEFAGTTLDDPDPAADGSDNDVVPLGEGDLPRRTTTPTTHRRRRARAARAPGLRPGIRRRSSSPARSIWTSCCRRPRCTCTCPGPGSAPAPSPAHLEGIGTTTIGQAGEFLRHCNVKVTEVLDPTTVPASDDYQGTDRLREALYLRNPRCVFPFATDRGRRKDIDHTVPYRPPEDGEPPGQTGPDSTALITRFHHRVKTHGRWRVKQPEPGVFLWRSPHGWIYLTDHTGSHRLGNSATAREFYARAPRLSREHAPDTGTDPPADQATEIHLIHTPDTRLDYQHRHAS